MTTLKMLQHEFPDHVAGAIPLKHIARKYLGISSHKAGDMARASLLPLPCYRLGSQKTPWLVRLGDLADHIDRRHQEALTDWEAAQVQDWPIPRQ